MVRLKTLGLFSKKLNTCKLACVSISIFCLSLISLNVNFLDSIKLTAAIVIQIIPGVYLWGKVHKDQKVSLVEYLGMGLALGTIMSILSFQLLRELPYGGFGWAFPFFCTIFFLIYESLFKMSVSVRISNERNSPGTKVYLGVISLVIYVQVWVWAKWNALNPLGWWKYHLDVPYFEALSNSIAKYGTSDSLMKPDVMTNYHWFAYGWIGALNESLDIEPFVVQTRFLPLLAMIMAATVAYSWTRDLVDNVLTAYSASLLIVLGPGFAIGTLVMLRSPSSAITAGWTLALSLLLFRCLKSLQIHGLTYIALGLLSVAVVGGKGINALLIGSGIFVVYANRVLQERTYRVKNSGVFLVVMLTLVLTYFTLIHTQDERSLKFGIFLGWPALMLTVLPFTLATLLKISGDKPGHRSELQKYSATILLVGALFSLITYDPAGGQIYFLVSAITVSIIPGLILVERMLHKNIGNTIKLTRFEPTLVEGFRLIALVVFLVGLIACATWIYFENSPGRIGDIGRAVAPLLIWIFIGSLTVFIKTKKKSFSINFTHGFTILLLATSVFASVVGVGASMFRGPIYAQNNGYVGYGKSTSTSIGSFSNGHVEAGNWIKDNVDSDTRFFTNRQCIDPKSTYENCNDIWFYASALSQRLFLIEGGAYNISRKEFARKMNKDQVVSLRFSLNPSLNDLDYLWERGVRWGWIDKMIIDRKDWLSFATTVYSNDDIAIIKLTNPSKIQAASN